MCFGITNSPLLHVAKQHYINTAISPTTFVNNEIVLLFHKTQIVIHGTKWGLSVYLGFAAFNNINDCMCTSLPNTFIELFGSTFYMFLFSSILFYLLLTFNVHWYAKIIPKQNMNNIQYKWKVISLKQFICYSNLYKTYLYLVAQ